MEQSQKPNKLENIVVICLQTLKSMHTSDDAQFMFKALESIGLPLEYCNNKEPVNVPFSTDIATALWTRGVTHIEPKFTSTATHFLGKRKKNQLSLMVSWETSPDMDSISVLRIRIPKASFLKRQEVFLSLFKLLINYFKPAYAYIGTQIASFRQQGPLWSQIPGIYWLNYFGKEYVDFIGVDHIDKCGWYKTELGCEEIFTWTDAEIGAPDKEVEQLENLYKVRLGPQFFPHTKYDYAESVPPTMLKIRHMIRGENPSPCPFRLYDERQKAKE